jgi:hypothetical protein
VPRYDERAQEFESVYSELKPPQDGILRLAFAPGSYRLRITFLNRVIESPADIEVQVQDGRITPVRVTMTESGAAQVPTSEWVRGRFGGRNKHGSNGTISYRLSAEAGPSAAYQPKDQTSYAP